MSKQATQRLLLLGWDAADWKTIQPLLDSGQMPNLQRLIERGVMGNLSTLQPILSPMLWTTVATGKRADKHGIYGFTEPKPDGSGVRQVSSSSLRAQPLWNIIEENGLRSAVAGWFASHPASALKGTVVSNHFHQSVGEDFDSWILAKDCIQPVSLREDLNDVRVHPADISGHELLPFVPKLEQVDQENDKHLNTLAKLLAKCVTVHGAGTYLAARDDWDLLAVYYDAIDLTCHDFMEMHAPKMAHVSDTDFDLYNNVVNEMYRFHDQMLGRYMQLVGDDTHIMIVSDHGFFNDELRPDVSAHTQTGAPLEWHREHGIFVFSGADVKQDELVYGASLLDITPTILSFFGLPVAKDMDGKALKQCFKQPKAELWCDSYALSETNLEQLEDEDPWAAKAALQQLIDLGYIDEIPEDAAKAIKGAENTRDNNLSQVYIESGQYDKAIVLLKNMLDEHPDNDDVKLRLASCLLNSGDIAGSRVMVDEVDAKYPDLARTRLLYGMLSFAEGKDDEAMAFYQQVQEQEGERPVLWLRMAQVLLRQKKWPEAEMLYEKCLLVDENQSAAHHGLGVVYYQQQRPELAVPALMRAVSLRFDKAMSHYYLAAALAATGEHEAAITSLNNLFHLNPNLPAGHELMAKLYELTGRPETEVLLHRSKADVRREQRAAGRV